MKWLRKLIGNTLDAKTTPVKVSARDEVAVQKLVQTWRFYDENGMIAASDVEKELLNYPKPMAVCRVFTGMLENDDWSSKDKYRLAGLFAKLVENGIGNVHFLDDLIRLYRKFDSHTVPFGERMCRARQFASAILHIGGGWEYVRKELAEEEALGLIINALIASGASNIDFTTHLSESEKKRAAAFLRQNANELWPWTNGAFYALRERLAVLGER